MFQDAEASKSAAIVLDHMHPFLIVDRKSVKDAEASLLRELTVICFEYRFDLRYDEDSSVAESNHEIKIIRKHALALSDALRRISKQAEFSLTKEMQFITRKDERDLIIRSERDISRLVDSCTAALKIKGKRRKPQAVSKCCKRLLAIRERLTGKAFTRTFDVAPGKHGDEFTSPDARFIQVAFEAIDKSVKTPTLVYELQTIFAKSGGD